MSSTLAVAQAALHLSSTTLGQLEALPNDQAEHKTSPWHLWPVATAGVSSLITAINAIALAILGNLPLAVLLGISAIGTGVVTAYLWSISTLQDLSAYVSEFASRVTALSQQALCLSGANKDLEKTRVALEAEVKERAVQFETKKQEVERTLQKLEHVTDELERTKQQVVEMEHILDGSHSLITEMTSKIGEFVALNKEVSNSSEILSKELFSIQALGTKLGSTIVGLDEQNKALLDKKRQAEEMAYSLYTRFVQIAELLVQLKKQREELEVNLKALQAVDSSLASHTSELHHVADDLDKGASDAQAFVDSLKPLHEITSLLKEKLAKKDSTNSASE